jgi:hypothetical protein
MKAAEVPVSAALEDSFSGLDKDLAGDAAKLMSVDASSSANAFDSKSLYNAINSCSKT